jgi:uncharacterized membrane protein YedE/YeeE
MIRLAALAFGVLCGIGFTLAGLHAPARLVGFVLPVERWDPTLGIGMLTAVLVAMVILKVTSGLHRPVLGGDVEQVAVLAEWKSLAGAGLFGLGWGLAGYHPFGALVSAGLFAPGAVVFLTSVLAGMIGHDVLTGNRRLLRQSG